MIKPSICCFLFAAAYVWFACNFDFSSFCGWTGESRTDAEWLIQTNGAPSVHRGPTLDHTGRILVFTFVLEPAGSGSALCGSSCYHAAGESLLARGWNIFKYCTL